ncbi:MAG: hypothetical protein HQK84_00265 [Nitrospinae bacterium]|nr:hypothetical protein [Nitrospinota bacterium]
MKSDKANYYRILVLCGVFLFFSATVYSTKIALNHLVNPYRYVSVVKENLEKSIGVKVDIKDIKWVTWSGLGLEIKGFSLETKSEKLDLERITLSFDTLSLLKKSIVIDKVKISNANIKLKLDEQILFFKLLQEGIQSLNKKLLEVNGFSFVTDIHDLSIRNISGKAVKVTEKKSGELPFYLENFEMALSEYFKTANVSAAGKIFDIDKVRNNIEFNQKIENIKPSTFQEIFIRNFPANCTVEKIVENRFSSFFVKFNEFPLKKLVEFFTFEKSNLKTNIISGKFISAGKGQSTFKANFQLINHKGKTLSSPNFAGVIDGKKLYLKKGSLVFEELPLTLGGEVNFSYQDKVVLTLATENIAINDLNKGKTVSTLSTDLAKKFKNLKDGTIRVKELKSFFAKPNIPFGELYNLDIQSIAEQLKTNFKGVDGELKNTMLSIDKNENYMVDMLNFSFDGRNLDVSEGVILDGKNTLTLKKAKFDIETETGSGDLDLVLLEAALKKLNIKSNKSIVFENKVEIPVQFTADTRNKVYTLDSQFELKEGKAFITGLEAPFDYKGAKGKIHLVQKNQSINIAGKITDVNVKYKNSFINKLSLTLAKKGDFFTAKVNKLKGKLDVAEVIGVKNNWENIKQEGNKMQGEVLFDMNKNDKSSYLTGKVTINKFQNSYVDDITGKNNALLVNGETSVVLDHSLKSYKSISFNNLEFLDSFNNKLFVSGSLNKIRGKDFARVEINGGVDSGAFQKGFEEISGENFFTTFGLKGFYGITGKANLKGTVKGYIDRPENINLNISFNNIALLDSDNGNLWKKMTGNIHLTPKKIIMTNLNYLCNGNKYSFDTSYVHFDNTGQGLYDISGKASINMDKYDDDFKLFSKSLKRFNISSQTGNALFFFKLKERKENSYIDLKYDFTPSDFTFWKDIHKSKNERLIIDLKGFYPNNPDKIYFKINECTIKFAQDTYTLVNSEFFDKGFFDINISSSEAKFENLLKLLDFTSDNKFLIKGKFKGVVNLKNFGNKLQITGNSLINSLTFKYGDNFFMVPVVEVSCKGENCELFPFRGKANNEVVHFNKSAIQIKGKGFNEHTLAITLNTDAIDFDKIFGINVYKNWYKKKISQIKKPENKVFVPEKTSPNCMYCDVSQYGVILNAGKLKYNNLEFTNFNSNFVAQSGILGLNNISTQYEDGKVLVKGMYNTFGEKDISMQAAVLNLDLKVVKAFVPDLDFFNNGKAFIRLYTSSKVNYKDLYDNATGEITFSFKDGDVDLKKWFKKINYKEGKVPSGENPPGWEFYSIGGKSVLFNDDLNVKQLLIKGSDISIAATGNFKIKPKNLDFRLAAYPFATLEEIPLVGKMLAGIVRYYEIKGNLNKINTKIVSEKELGKKSLNTFETIIKESSKSESGK